MSSNSEENVLFCHWQCLMAVGYEAGFVQGKNKKKKTTPRP
jgi:hypothetical protein